MLRLRRDALARRDGIGLLVSRALRPRPCDHAAVVAAFAFKADEERFARALLAHKTQLWLFRVNQRAFAGDFVVVDASSPTPARRRVLVVDLKLGAPVRLGGGGAGVQLRNAPDVVRALAREGGVIDEATPFELATGGAEALLRLLRAAPPA